MAHYAFIDENNLVTEVIVASEPTENYNPETDIITPNGERVLKTSYNTYGGIHILGGDPFRKNYAGVGFSYDPELDAFIPPKPYPSWVLDQETCFWNPPSQPPQGRVPHTWHEDTISWVPVKAVQDLLEQYPYPEDGVKYSFDYEANEWVPANV